MTTDITDQGEEEKKKISSKQENVLSNAEMLFIKTVELIEQFSKNNIISKNEKFYEARKKSEENIPEKLEQKSDQSIRKWVQVPKDRFDFIKLKINRKKMIEKKSVTMIDNERYTLNDANKLINKTAE